MQRVTIFLALLIVSCFALAPLFQADEHKINGSYIIVYHDKIPQWQIEEHKITLLKMHPSHQITHSWEVVLRGYAAILSQEGLNFVLNAPQVSFVEEDKLMFATQIVCSEQEDATWGLARISMRGWPTSATTYEYSTTGDGVNAYIMDTGIYREHPDFEGRAKFGISYIVGETADADFNGHGTHVAGTVGGKTWGVAKGVTLVAIKVLGGGGSGATSGIISGCEWAAKDGTEDRDVANLSLGGGVSTALDNAVNGLSKAGIFVVVAAGNSNANACSSSPSRASDVFTVGATSQAPENSPWDNRASFSNYGSCVNIFAPGETITSTWISPLMTRTISGTSMASPHVCGAAALIRGQKPTSDKDTKIQLIDQASIDTIRNPGTGSPNLVLYSGCP